MKSKRSAYRYKCSGEAVRYKTAFSEGGAELVNISTDGCALQEATCPVSIKEKILIIITLADDTVLEIQGKVMRNAENGFGIRFTIIEEETKLRLRNYFAEQQRQNRKKKNRA